jgi:hypothetical protein
LRELPESEGDNEGAVGSSFVSLCIAMTHPKTDDGTSSQGSRIKTDDRMISAEQLRAKVCEGSRLLTEQQEDLYKVLAKCQQHFKKKTVEMNTI